MKVFNALGTFGIMSFGTISKKLLPFLFFEWLIPYLDSNFCELCLFLLNFMENMYCTLSFQ